MSDATASILRNCGSPILCDYDRRQLLANVHMANVLWVRLRHLIDQEVIDAARDLQIVVSPTTGHNHIDEGALALRQITLLSLRTDTGFLSTLPATAEHTIALMLSVLRLIPFAHQSVMDNEWNRYGFMGEELYGKTVGILGYGRIGRMVGKYCQAFGTKVIAYDHRPSCSLPDEDVSFVSFEVLVRESDILSVHLPYSEANRDIIDGKVFRMMKPTAWFINTSRGELVNEVALVDALEAGQISGAAIDVLAGETSLSLHDHALIEYARKATNVVVTPHLGGFTKESLPRAEEHMARRLATFLQSGA